MERGEWLRPDSHTQECTRNARAYLQSAWKVSIHYACLVETSSGGLEEDGVSQMESMPLKESSSTAMSQLWPISWLDVEGVVFLAMLAGRMTKFALENEYIYAESRNSTIPRMLGAYHHNPECNLRG